MEEDSSTRHSRSRSQGRRESQASAKVGAQPQHRSRSRRRSTSHDCATIGSEGDIECENRDIRINSLAENQNHDDDQGAFSPEQQHAAGNEDNCCSDSDLDEVAEADAADRFEALLERVSGFFDHSLPAAASQEALQAIRQVTFDGTLAATVKQDAQCVICCCDFKSGETLEQLPRCEHLFHSECIRRWLGRTSSCPICRHVLRGIGEGLSPGSYVRVYDLCGSRTGACVRKDKQSSCWFVRLSGSQDEHKVNVEDLEVIQRLSVGAVVRVVGLVNAAHLNGSRGECVKWDPRGSRWQVRIESGEIKCVRPENLNVEELAMPDAINHVANVVMGNPSAMRDMTALFMEALNQPGAQEQIGEVLEHATRNPEMQRMLQQFVSRLNDDGLPPQVASLMRTQGLPNLDRIGEIMNSPLCQQLFQQMASAPAS